MRFTRTCFAVHCCTMVWRTAAIVRRYCASAVLKSPCPPSVLRSISASVTAGLTLLWARNFHISFQPFEKVGRLKKSRQSSRLHLSRRVFNCEQWTFKVDVYAITCFAVTFCPFKNRGFNCIVTYIVATHDFSDRVTYSLRKTTIVRHSSISCSETQSLFARIIICENKSRFDEKSDLQPEFRYRKSEIFIKHGSHNFFINFSGYAISNNNRHTFCTGNC